MESRATMCCPIRENIDQPGRIIGGEDTKPGDYPWMAALLNVSNTRRPFCGGSLISPRHVLTAGHCVHQKGVQLKTSSFLIRIGEHNFESISETEHQDFSIKQIHIHPNYEELNRDIHNDLAIIELYGPYEAKPKAVYLPNEPGNFEGSSAYVIGWGLTQTTTEIQPPVLQQVLVHVYSQEVCRKNYPCITNTHLCAGHEKGRKDSCQGDSGGPLFVVGQEGKWVQVGIVSYGYGCAEPEFPGVYANVSSHFPLGSENGTDVQKRDYRKFAEPFQLINGELNHQSKKCAQPKKVILGKEERNRVLDLYHRGIGGGHFGMNATLRKLEKYWWKNMTSDVKRFCSSCIVCQKANPMNNPAPAKLHPVKIFSRLFHRWGVDLGGPLNESKQGNSYLWLTERYNQTLIAKLTAHMTDRGDDWETHLRSVMIGYRWKVQCSSKFSPFELMFGVEPRFPYELDSPITSEDLADPIWTEETGEEIEKRMGEIELRLKNRRQEGLQNLEKAQEKQKDAYDLKRSGPAYNVGDKVLKRNARKDTRMGGKLEER
ncbi:unnamed protein product [Darwinula stevensoni]|uniref:limulus clotting factor C n=1 Tax=Darwinula stevensoni TaxID=69355 RepID=A0A7R9A2Y6_9CRUS|nr:unnamed protein product [Darwinula stevensoni]CAG0889651.1 unnamed protein product [Darwinula stevensoni]